MSGNRAIVARRLASMTRHGNTHAVLYALAGHQRRAVRRNQTVMLPAPLEITGTPAPFGDLAARLLNARGNHGPEAE